MKRRSIIVLVLFFVFAGSALGEEATYQGLSNFTRVLDLIERKYVDNVDTEKLAISAIEGMLKTLDPYSAYLTPERYKELEIGTSGEFGGVGIEISVENDLLTVITPIEGSPAAKAGIKPGDLIIAIDGKSTQGLSVDEAVKSLRGPKGSAVKITIQSQGDKNPREVVLVRDIIYVKSVNSKLLDGRIGYIKLSQFQEKTSEELVKAIEELESGDRGRPTASSRPSDWPTRYVRCWWVSNSSSVIDEGLIV